MESEYIICPFNNAHKILRFRMPAHIIKCQKSYRGEPLEQCPFNAQHFVKKIDMKDHFAACKDYQIAFREEHENYFEKNRCKT